MSYYLRRPLWRCTMYGGREMVETFVIVEVDDQATVTVTPYVRNNTLTQYFKAMHNYPWVLSRSGIHPMGSTWDDIISRCQNPWDVLEHVAAARARDGHQSFVEAHIPSEEALVLDVKRAIMRIAHASMYYLSTRDHGVFDSRTSTCSSWSLALKVMVGGRMRHVEVHDVLSIDDQGHRWVDKMFRDMVNVDTVRCLWWVPR